MGWVHKDYALLPHLSVFKELGWDLGHWGRPPEIGQDSKPWNGWALDLAERRPSQLSGEWHSSGSPWRARSGACAAVTRQALAALDLQTRGSVRAHCGNSGCTLSCVTVLVTHSPLEAVVRAGSRDRVGQGSCRSTPELCASRSPYVAFGGESVPGPQSGPGSRSDQGSDSPTDRRDLGVKASRICSIVSPGRSFVSARASPQAAPKKSVPPGVLEQFQGLLRRGSGGLELLRWSPRSPGPRWSNSVLIEGGRAHASFKATAVMLR